MSSGLSFLQAVGESVSMPLVYYDNNITGLLNLLKAMKPAGLKNIGEMPFLDQQHR